jgi:pSer/pThr/pTyr-binding forkhead associated (FHA) protein
MALVVRLPNGQALRFTASFHIGRERGCDVEVADGHVSRRHAEVSRVEGTWIIRDLQSSNGLFVNGSRVDSAPIGSGIEVVLGADGPTLTIEPEDIARPSSNTGDEDEGEEDQSLDSYAQRYFGSDDDEDESVGGHTLMIRRAFQKVQRQQRRRQRVVIAGIALIALGAGAYALYVHRALSQQMQQAQDLFYQMKAQDLIVVDLEQKLAQSGAPPGQQLAAYMAERRRLEQNYDQYVAGLFDRKLNEKERLVLRVTRLFGECDAAAPPDYIGEVMRYVAKWQQTGRFASALKRAQDNGYVAKIASAFMEQNLPPQYFYLAMQESDFDPTRSGPPTRWGIAKGMWQFIPTTAREYGLATGPLAGQQAYDRLDDRFNWEKATPAAARYIKRIYSTDAQASGLLVMASYNWGEWRVTDYLQKMPQDPRHRNFWKFLAQYRERLPLQTYDYVFYIVSAAVIGENPRLFGFQFDPPLAFASQP